MSEYRVNYKGKPETLVVDLIHTYKRHGDPLLAGCPVSGGSGFKDYIKNTIWTLFQKDPEVDAISLVRGRGPVFAILRKGTRYFDIGNDEVEIAQRVDRKPAPAPSSVRRADTA